MSNPDTLLISWFSGLWEAELLIFTCRQAAYSPLQFFVEVFYLDYKKYKDARDLSWKILLDENVQSLPVSVSDLCRSMGIAMKYYAGTDDSDGKSVMLDGQPLILVSRNKPIPRQRFTAAHELGHILLGHIGQTGLVNREPSADDNPLEHEANVFAARLLAPACVLWGCGVRSEQDIMDLCSISRQAAEFRWQRLQVLLTRNKFLTSPLERRLYERFADYIAAHKL